MKIPLHIPVDDVSSEADLSRLELHQHMANLTGGNGFRFPSGKTQKRHNKTRPERIGDRLAAGEAA